MEGGREGGRERYREAGRQVGWHCGRKECSLNSRQTAAETKECLDQLRNDPSCG